MDKQSLNSLKQCSVCNKQFLIYNANNYSTNNITLCGVCYSGKQINGLNEEDMITTKCCDYCGRKFRRSDIFNRYLGDVCKQCKYKHLQSKL